MSKILIPTDKELYEIASRNIMADILEEFQKRPSTDKTGNAHVFIDHDDLVSPKALELLQEKGIIIDYDSLGIKEFTYSAPELEYTQLQKILYHSEIENDPLPEDQTYELMELKVFYDTELLEKFKQNFKSKNTFFDLDTGLLHFKNKFIPFNKNSAKKQYTLMKVIFSQPHKVWGYDEINDQSEVRDVDDKDGFSYRQVAYAIKNKITKATSVEDFLKVTHYEVNINKKHL